MLKEKKRKYDIRCRLRGSDTCWRCPEIGNMYMHTHTHAAEEKGKEEDARWEREEVMHEVIKI